MCYPDRNYYITFFFQLYKDFQKSTHAQQTECKGCPKVYPESSLILFFAIMMLKRIHRFKAQHDFLLEHQEWVKRLKFESVPSRTTLSRRYKHLTARVEKFVEYLGDFGISLDTETPPEVVFEDKISIKHTGLSGIKRTEKPIISPKVYATLIQMRVGQQVSIGDGFMATHCI